MTRGHDSGRASADEAFEKETLRFLADVHRFAASLTRDASDADDLVQETYLRAYRAPVDYPAPSHPTPLCSNPSSSPSPHSPPRSPHPTPQT
ncbi:MAG: sigma factor, partial [Gemmatimonadetes bacterium]|nr:sigma factor [Gemmatimonadota bacterium]